MKVGSLAIIAFSAISQAAAGVLSFHPASIKPNTRSTSDPPAEAEGASRNIYIVEFDEQHAAQANSKGTKAYQLFHEYMGNGFKSDHLPASVPRVNYSTRYEWDQKEMFRGMSILLDKAEDAVLLSAAPGVISVQRASVVHAPEFRATPASPEIVEALTRKNRKGLVQNDSSIPSVDNFGPHVMTGVDRLHALQLYGEGVTVALM